MSEQEKIKLDIKEILHELGIAEEKWRQSNQLPFIAVNRHPLIDNTIRNVNVNHKVI